MTHVYMLKKEGLEEEKIKQALDILLETNEQVRGLEGISEEKKDDIISNLLKIKDRLEV